MTRFGCLLHLPKTAGNAMLATLSRAGAFVWASPHGTVGLVRERYEKRHSNVKSNQPPWAEAYKFGFVRNPWDRYVSFYHHSCGSHEQPHEDFRDWLTHRDLPRQEATTARGMFDHGEMDFVGQYERLMEGVITVASALAVSPPELRLKNPGRRRPTRDWRPYYDGATHALVERLASWEIERFGYSFDDPASPEPTRRALFPSAPAGDADR